MAAAGPGPAESTLGGDVRTPLRRGLQQWRDRRDDENLGGGGGGITASFACAAQERLHGSDQRETAMSNPNKPNDNLEQALRAMRSDPPTPEAGNAAHERVCQHLSAQSGVNSDHQPDGAIQGCESVRALLGAYQRRELTPARALLIQDHLRECGDCHRAAEAANRPVLAWKQELPVGRPAHFKWLATAAAMLLAAVGVYMLQDWLAVP